jgi:hypothetical protein
MVLLLAVVVVALAEAPVILEVVAAEPEVVKEALDRKV